MEKMTIHRGLTELKILDVRIYDAINDGIFVTANKNSNMKIDGSTIEEHERKIQSSHDKVISLIERRNKIKSAIVESNAKTIVTIAGKEMTVAEAIERKSSVSYEKHYLATLERAFSNSSSAVNIENEELPEKLEKYLASALGSKESASKEDIDYHTDTFIKRNTWDLIDPLKINDVIEELKDNIHAFELDVDSVLSESNAVTFIFDDK